MASLHTKNSKYQKGDIDQQYVDIGLKFV